MRQSVLDVASDIAVRHQPAAPAVVAPAGSIDLGMDTTFVRSCAPGGPRHHEVLIGVATAGDRRIRRFGGVIAALDPPHRLITAALRQLGCDPDTTITGSTRKLGALYGEDRFGLSLWIDDHAGIPAGRDRTGAQQCRESQAFWYFSISLTRRIMPPSSTAAQPSRRLCWPQTSSP